MSLFFNSKCYSFTKCSCNQSSVTSENSKIFELNTYECIIAIYLVKKNPTANFFELGDFNVSMSQTSRKFSQSSSASGGKTPKMVIIVIFDVIKRKECCLYHALPKGLYSRDLYKAYLPRLVGTQVLVYKKFEIAMDFFGDRVTITTAKRVERNGF